jgi:hypothetical protein
MDVSYDEEKIEHVVADLNRMKQGTSSTCSDSIQADSHSARQPNYERRQIYIQEEWGTQDHCIHGRLC